ncbi:hypothetical protein SFUMM280S_10310 [Streptomyces fumanus]
MCRESHRKEVPEPSLGMSWAEESSTEYVLPGSMAPASHSDRAWKCAGRECGLLSVSNCELYEKYSVPVVCWISPSRSRLPAGEERCS